MIRRELPAKPRALTRADVANTLLDIAQEGHLSGVAVNVHGR